MTARTPNHTEALLYAAYTAISLHSKGMPAGSLYTALMTLHSFSLEQYERFESVLVGVGLVEKRGDLLFAIARKDEESSDGRAWRIKPRSVERRASTVEAQRACLCCGKTENECDLTDLDDGDAPHLKHKISGVRSLCDECLPKELGE